jgi:LuxR family maltose regulon positive regulatory protein
MVALGTARLHIGERDEADPLLREGLRLATWAGLGHAQVAALSQLGYREAGRGHLRDAMALGLRAGALASRLGLSESSDLAWARMAMAEAYLQWGRLDEGLRSIEDALDRAGRDPEVLAAGRITQARLWAASGAVSAAFDAIAAARPHTTQRTVPAPLRTTLLLAEAELRTNCGDPNTAQRLLSELNGAGPHADWASVVRAEILLAEGKPAAAAALVAAHVHDRSGTWSLTNSVRAAILSTQASCAMGDRDGAFEGLRVALRIAEAHGHRSAFVTARARLGDLLDTYASGLEVKSEVLVDVLAAMDRYPRQPARSLVEPLTDRERTVLRYLRGTMSNVEIATALYVSINTVKTHLKSIYRKLGTSHRQEAVRRARDLRLL